MRCILREEVKDRFYGKRLKANVSKSFLIDRESKRERKKQGIACETHKRSN